MNTNDNRLKAHKLINHIFQDLLPAHGMAQRPEQIQLSHRMLDAMQDGRIALCDAGTGIGKTYAYLAAATAASAFPTGQIARPIIISTSSIALQNAVLTEYLPLLSCVLLADGILTKPLKAVIRKGKSHYVCDERLDRRLRQVYPAKKNPEALTALRTLRETLDMDRVSHLSGYDRERVCVPQVCDCKQKDCRYQRFLKTCDKNQFLFQICNHNLLVADAIHRSQGRRPIFPEHSVIIVDEAHKLPEAAREMFGMTLTAGDIQSMIHQLRAERYLLAADVLAGTMGPLLRKLTQPREETEPLVAYLRLLTIPSRSLLVIEKQVGRLLSAQGRRQLEKLRGTVSLLSSPRTNMILYTADDGDGGTMLCATVSDLTEQMRQVLWRSEHAFVLASGTLAVGDDFHRFRSQTGLMDGRRVTESVSPSPFDYKRNCLLYLPQLPPSQSSETYYDELADEIAELIRAAWGHALVLFTSYAAMSAVKDRLREQELSFPLFTLGRNAMHMTERFRQTPGAVLLATGAAWEGFDFPGDCVSLLVIPRLPFAYPDALKEKEREEYASLRQFIQNVAVPEMQIKLRQGFGRAIRTETDTCVIAILDERASHGRRYYAAMRDALPDMRTTSSLRAVTKFLRELKPESYFEVDA
ncbi:ATP-dependent DNA helicase [Hominicoprocola fusiformis]